MGMSVTPVYLARLRRKQSFPGPGADHGFDPKAASGAPVTLD
jgi:hypothetical protein